MKQQVIEDSQLRDEGKPISCRGRAAYAVFWQMPREENLTASFRD